MKNFIKSSFIFSCMLLLSLQTSFAQENALGFDGNGDYADCGTHPSLNIVGTTITLEAWVYSTSFTTNVWQGNVVNKSGGGDNGYMLRVGNNGQVNFNIGNGAWNEINSPTGTVSLLTWHHIAGTYDGTTMRLYVDGVQVATGALNTNIGAASNSLFFGDDPQFTGRYFPGRIDEVRVWNTVRTPQEIVADMNNISCTPLPTGLVAYYRFNQGIANGNNTGLTMIIDELGNSNGTLMNSALSGTTSNWVEGIDLVTTNDTINICGGDSVLLGGSYQTITGIYADTLQGIGGCDSVIVTNLIVNPMFNSTVTMNICTGDSVLLGGVYQTTAGTYADTFQTVAGCDSILSTTLVINPLIAPTNAVMSICQGDSVLLGGSYQLTSGTYMDTFQIAATGCDSVVTTVLTVNPVPTITVNMGICTGDSALLGGSYQTTSGTYMDTFQVAATGCDSIVTTILTVNSISATLVNKNLCTGDSILLGGSYQTTAGIYVDTLQSTITGCDSLVRTTLNVVPLPVVFLAPFSPDTMCIMGGVINIPSGAPIGGTYSGNGVSGTTFNPNVSGVGTHYVVYSYTDIGGCTGVDSTAMTIELCMGIENTEQALDLLIFPNPMQDKLTVQLNGSDDEIINISLVDVMGKVMDNFTVSGDNQNKVLNITDLSNGMYFITVTTNRTNVVRQITKQ